MPGIESLPDDVVDNAYFAEGGRDRSQSRRENSMGCRRILSRVGAIHREEEFAALIRACAA
jgi:hypothetical protein